MIVTAGTERKRAIAKAFGADHAVDYRDPRWPDLVRNLTPGRRGVDIVYESVGIVDQSIKCTAWNGRVLIVGFAGGKIEKVAMNKILLRNISLVGVYWGMYTSKEPETVVATRDGLAKLIADGKFKPVEFTDQQFVGLETLPAALHALESRDTWGRVVVKTLQHGQSKI